MHTEIKTERRACLSQFSMYDIRCLFQRRQYKHHARVHTRTAPVLLRYSAVPQIAWKKRRNSRMLYSAVIRYPILTVVLSSGSPPCWNPRNLQIYTYLMVPENCRSTLLWKNHLRTSHETLQTLRGIWTPVRWIKGTAPEPTSPLEANEAVSQLLLPGPINY